tara:strand:+ start:412 stop:801 length:390 start_codon:yes stop_codon:yes gene_type:complete
MELKQLDERLKKIHNDLAGESKKLEDTAQRISSHSFQDEDDEINAKEMYYSFLSEKEKIYQKKNDEYKKLISQFSLAYLELTEFYVGPELPRQEETTFFDSKEDLNELYCLFAMGFFMNIFGRNPQIIE